MTDSQTTHTRRRARLLSVAPGMPTADLARTVAHYERLGFTFTAPGSPTIDGEEFAIGRRDGIELHFALKPEHDPATTATWVYVTVDDADALSDELAAVGMTQGREPHDTDYGMRELAHIDPDGNLVLFGSPLAGNATAKPNDARRLSPDEPLAVELVDAVTHGDVARLTRLLDERPWLASARIGSLPPLHYFANAPGHRPNPVAVVTALAAAGADLDAHALDTWHHETALHWAASNDDVELIDALLDAGADIEHPGSSINGNSPLSSAVGYAQWAAARRLWERGAETRLGHAGGLGDLSLVRRLVEQEPAPAADDLGVSFWNACRAGHLEVARYLLDHGAEVDWPAPWSGETPLDIARNAQRADVVAWLVGLGATPGTSEP